MPLPRPCPERADAYRFGLQGRCFPRSNQAHRQTSPSCDKSTQDRVHGSTLYFSSFYFSSFYSLSSLFPLMPVWPPDRTRWCTRVGNERWATRALHRWQLRLCRYILRLHQQPVRGSLLLPYRCLGQLIPGTNCACSRPERVVRCVFSRGTARAHILSTSKKSAALSDGRRCRKSIGLERISGVNTGKHWYQFQS